MSLVTLDDLTRAEHSLSLLTLTEPPASTSTLYDILCNSLILRHVAAFLPTVSLLRLAATSRLLRDIIHHTPGTFRRLDLSDVNFARRHAGPSIDVIPPESSFSAPLRGVFASLQGLNLLQNVQTLILDELCVTADVCDDIINDPAFNVRILSLRGATGFDHYKLIRSLEHACRRSRPSDSPKLQALYIFGSRGSLGDSSKRESWWETRGQIISEATVCDRWAACMVACQGIIAFDAVLCGGPRHRTSPCYNAAKWSDGKPAVARFGLPPCDGCGAAPEGLIHPRSGSAYSRPLLSPPPLFSSLLRAATAPKKATSSLVCRCQDCLRQRYCNICSKWWCESCFRLQGPNTVVINDEDDEDLAIQFHIQKADVKSRVSKSCWECGDSCNECINRTQRICIKCCAGYCIIHNEGSSGTHCDCENDFSSLFDPSPPIGLGFPCALS